MAEPPRAGPALSIETTMPLDVNTPPAADGLDSPQAIRSFLERALASKNLDDLLHALAVVARAVKLPGGPGQQNYSVPGDTFDHQAEVARLRDDCAAAYLFVGRTMMEPNREPFTQDEVVRVLDNLAAACNGEPRPHPDPMR